MSENILLIIKDIEPLKPKIKIAPGVILESNKHLGPITKPISPVVGKKIELKPKPIQRQQLIPIRGRRRIRRLGMNFL